MKAVFDLDDTISIHKNRDYPNARPIEKTIAQMRKLKADGWDITIYTSRGQVSCNGDLQLIEQRNRAVAEEWLKKHEVPYDRLVFGKPIADLYVDDKGISLEEFQSQTYGYLQGGSGRSVYRMGSIVKKDFVTQEECNAFKRWTEKNDGTLRIPRIRSWLYSSVYMDYIDGIRLCDAEAINIPEFIDVWERCSRKDQGSADIEKQLAILELNRTGEPETDGILDYVESYLRDTKEWFSQRGSFSHGDMTLCNIIQGKDGQLYFLDARDIEGASSYLLDIAKFRMALNGYEKRFGLSETDHTRQVPELDEWLEQKGLKEFVLALEIMDILRLYRYKKGAETVLPTPRRITVAGLTSTASPRA